MNWYQTHKSLRNIQSSRMSLNSLANKPTYSNNKQTPPKIDGYKTRQHQKVGDSVHSIAVSHHDCILRQSSLYRQERPQLWKWSPSRIVDQGLRFMLRILSANPNRSLARIESQENRRGIRFAANPIPVKIRPRHSSWNRPNSRITFFIIFRNWREKPCLWMFHARDFVLIYVNPFEKHRGHWHLRNILHMEDIGTISIPQTKHWKFSKLLMPPYEYHKKT